MRPPRSLAVAVVAALFLLAGCDEGGDDGTEPTPSEATTSEADGEATSAPGDDLVAELEALDVAATVDDIEITGTQVAGSVALQRDQALAGLEGDALAEAEAELVRSATTSELQVAVLRRLAEEEYDLAVDEAEVDEAFAATAEQAGGEEAFATFLEQRGIDEAEARDRIGLEVLLGKLQDRFAEEAGVDEAVVREEFETRDADGQYEQSTVRHILLETEEDAEAALARLDDGEDFSEVAMDVSTGPSGPDGGELGSAPRGAYVPAFEEAVWSEDTELGEVLGPVETEFGFHLIIVDERTTQEFADVEEALRQELSATAAASAFDDAVQGALDASEVSVDASIGTWDDEQDRVVAAEG